MAKRPLESNKPNEECMHAETEMRGQTRNSKRSRKLRNLQRNGDFTNLATEDANTSRKIKGTMQTRSATRGVANLISKLTRDQRDAVKDIGLGALLELKPFDINRKLCRWLSNKFDPNCRTLNVHGKKLKVSPKDVGYILGLKSDDSDIKKKGVTDVISEKENDVSVLSGNKIKINDLRDDLISMVTYGNEFKIKFALYIVTALLCPTTNTQVTQGFIHILKNVNELKNMNWGKLVLDHLVKGIDRKRNRRQNGLSGCLLFLQLFYLEHVRFGHESTMAMSRRSVPRIVDWDESKVKERVDQLLTEGILEDNDGRIMVHDETISLEDKLSHLEQRIVKIENSVEEIKEKLTCIPVLVKMSLSSMLNSIKEEILTEFKRKTSVDDPLDSIGTPKEARSHSCQPEKVDGKFFSAENFNPKATSKFSSSVELFVDEISKPIPPFSRLDGKVSSFENPPKTVDGCFIQPKLSNYHSHSCAIPLHLEPNICRATEMVDASFPIERMTEDRVNDLANLTEWYSDNFEPFTKSPNQKNFEDLNESDRVSICSHDSLSYPSTPVKGLKRGRPVICCKPRKLFESSSAKLLDHVQIRRASLLKPSQFTGSPYIVEQPLEKGKTQSIQWPLPNFSLQEQKLIRYVFDVGDEKEVMVEIYMDFAQRSNLQKLKPAQWLESEVINLYVCILTMEQRRKYADALARVWFLPDRFSQQCLSCMKTPEQIFRSYFSKNRYGGDISKCEKILIPMNDDNVHWYLCMVELREQNVMIIDSMLPNENAKRISDVQTMLQGLHNVLSFGFGENYNQNVSTFFMKIPKWIPQQDNLNDCGIYVIKFMQKHDQIKEGINLELESSNLERQKMLIELFFHQDNKRKDVIMKKLLI